MHEGSILNWMTLYWSDSSWFLTTICKDHNGKWLGCIITTITLLHIPHQSNRIKEPFPIHLRIQVTHEANPILTQWIPSSNFTSYALLVSFLMLNPIYMAIATILIAILICHSVAEGHCLINHNTRHIMDDSFPNLVIALLVLSYRNLTVECLYDPHSLMNVKINWGTADESCKGI